MKPISFFALAILLALVSCGDNSRVAGGVDGNPNFLEGRLLLPGTNEPAAKVPVVLSGADGAAARSQAANAWIARDTTWTDSDGRYRFALATDGRYHLEARVGDSLVMSRDIDYSAASGKRVEDAVVPLPSAKALVVGDFELRSATAALAAWFSDAYGLHLLSNDSTRIAISPSSILSDPASGIIDCAVQGRCYHLSTTLVAADAGSEPTEIYETFRPSPNGCFDLSKADSLTLRVRGSGDLLLSWWGKDAPLTWSNWSITSKILPLSTEWSTLSIPTNTILFNQGTDTIPWDRSCLHKFTFGLRGQGELWIDDIRLHGTSLLDLQTP